MTAASLARRRCASALNSLHSIPYFAPDLAGHLAPYGVTDEMSVYLAGRAAPLGAVAAGVVTAAFNAFAPGVVADRLPALWQQVTPAQALAARLRASDDVLRRVLGEQVLASPEVFEAAELAACATEACERPGRPMFSANADLAVPDAPHLLLWHATTLLREYRGDGHVVALGALELGGLDALVLDCASTHGMPREVVMTKRGWTEHDWALSRQRLSERRLMDGAGALTAAGVAVREDLEFETDRLDRRPYVWLGSSAVGRLTDIVERLLAAAAPTAFPPVLREFFVPSR